MRALALIPLIACLAGCGMVDAVQNGLAYSRAVEADLLAETGVKPAVGFNWNNGTLTSVMVTFPKLYTDKPLPELAEKVRAAVLKEFKQRPRQLVLGFAVSG
ncbi:hypothetical protein ACQR18_07290 [Bradyrhizobium oligotrophicum]|uniref:hypothetical protein n=1 Tax=Bradyrhizobium oligotrophicum TaxID=44255 RepID=UPI003EB7C2C0